MKIWSIDREREYSIHENFSLLSFIDDEKITLSPFLTDEQMNRQTLPMDRHTDEWTDN